MKFNDLLMRAGLFFVLGHLPRLLRHLAYTFFSKNSLVFAGILSSGSSGSDPVFRLRETPEQPGPTPSGRNLFRSWRSVALASGRVFRPLEKTLAHFWRASRKSLTGRYFTARIGPIATRVLPPKSPRYLITPASRRWQRFELLRPGPSMA